MDSNKNDRVRFVFKNSQIYNNIAIIYLYQCFLNFSSSCRWQYNRKWVSVFLVGISFAWYDWQGSWIVYFLSIIVYVFSGKPREYKVAYNSKNIWYNPQKIYSKRHKFYGGHLNSCFCEYKAFEMEKTILPRRDDTEKCCLSLTSVSVRNSKFSFLFCQTLTRP